MHDRPLDLHQLGAALGQRIRGLRVGAVVVSLALLGCRHATAVSPAGAGTPSKPVVEREPPVPMPELRELTMAETWGCALDEHRELWCWGAHPRHEPGQVEWVARRVEMPGPVVTLATAVSWGPMTDVSCASFDNHPVECWEHWARGVEGWGGPFPGTEGARALAMYTAGSSDILCAQTTDDAILCFDPHGSEDPIVVLGVRDLGQTASRMLALADDGRVLWLTDRPSPYGETRVSATNEYGQLPGATRLIDSRSAHLLCGLDDAGALICPNTPGPLRSREGRPLPPLDRVASASVQACALTRDARVLCAGSNRWGQLGPGGALELARSDLRPRFDGVRGLGELLDVEVTDDRSCVLSKDEVRCFGRRLGVSTADQRSELELDARRLISAKGQTCAIDGDDRSWCWGEGIDGFVPRRVGLPIGPPVGLDGHGCWVDGAGQVACGALEPAPGEPEALLLAGASAPRVAEFLDPSGAWAERVDGKLRLHEPDLDHPKLERDLDASLQMLGPSCALDATAKLVCYWSQGSPDGPYTESGRVPLAKVAALASHCALLHDGRVSCWDDPRFVVDVGLEGGVDIAASRTEVCVRRSDDSLVCASTEGEGGVARPVDGPVIDLVAGPRNVCALRASGTVSCWGDNARGELGVVPPDVSAEGWTIEFVGESD